MNRTKSKNQPDPKSDEGNKEAKTIHLEGSPDTSKTKEAIEIREDPVAVEEKSSNEHSKEPKAALSAHQMQEQEEGTVVTQVGGNLGRSEDDFESKEEEEEEGEIELTTPRLSKTKGRKTKKEAREKATYKDKLQGSQLTLEKLLKNMRNTRQQGHAQKGMPSNSKSK